MKIKKKDIEKLEKIQKYIDKEKKNGQTNRQTIKKI